MFPQSAQHCSTVFLPGHLISDWRLDLFSLVPNISNCSHEMSAVVHGDRTQQFQDLLTEIL